MIVKNVVIRVSNFSGLASFLRHSTLLAIGPSLMKEHLLSEFKETALPYELPELSMYMLWHQRYKDDAAHRWLRAQLMEVCQALNIP